MNDVIMTAIREYKRGGKDKNENMLCITNQLEPVINKYAKKLIKDFGYEDMRQELLIAVIEAVERIERYENEGQCITYLVKAIKLRYLELYRKSKMWKERFTSLEETYMDSICDNKETYTDIEFEIDLKKIEKANNSLKREIIESILKYNMNDAEIACRLQISRQYVNRCKKEIFAELKNY